MADAAQAGIDYVPAVLEETRQSADGLLAVGAASFAGWTREGAAVEDVLHASVRISKQAIAAGHTPAGAILLGERSLARTVPSLLADANRDAVQVTMTPTRVAGYVRMLNGPSCRRCIVLAGRWYRWNEGFQRHPKCDCRHIPASEDVAGSFTTDPYEAFRAMSEEEQDRTFGKSEARAIREGADIFRVVNVRQRGLPGVKAYKPPRMTVDEIYRTAGSRSRAVTMLTEQGYILPSGQQARGSIGYGALGLDSEAAHYLGAGEFGRGGTRVGATAAHRAAGRAGVRDSLDRYTQTAAERRLADAVRAAEAVADGRNPYGTYRLTNAGRERAARDLNEQINILRDGLTPESGVRVPKQVYTLADLLGVNYR